MIIKNKNYSNKDLPKELPKEFIECNFSKLNPLTVDEKKVGHEIFKGVTDKIIFRNCNLTNVIPPENSILINCNTTITDLNLKEEIYTKNIIYGKYNIDTKKAEYKTVSKENKILSFEVEL